VGLRRSKRLTNVIPLKPVTTTPAREDEVAEALDTLHRKHTESNLDGILVIGFSKNVPFIVIGGQVPVLTGIGALRHVETILHETLLLDGE